MDQNLKKRFKLVCFGIERNKQIGIPNDNLRTSLILHIWCFNLMDSFSQMNKYQLAIVILSKWCSGEPVHIVAIQFPNNTLISFRRNMVTFVDNNDSKRIHQF